MSILNQPEHLVREHLSQLMELIDSKGGWAGYAAYMGGEGDTCFPELDLAIEELYAINEKVHRIANALCIKYGVEW